MEQLGLNLGEMNNLILADDYTEKTPQSLNEKVEYSKRALILAAEMSKTYYGEPLIIAYSGGKDSDVLLFLAENCLNVGDYEVLNSHTTVDAPETVYHIREVFQRLMNNGIKATINYPKDKNGNPITMWNLIPKKRMPPTRLQRYCCAILKETSTPNRMVALGVRESESSGRQGRNTFGTRGSTKQSMAFFSLTHAEEVYQEAKEMNDPVWDCTLIKTMREHKDTIVNPIYEWTDADVWDFIRNENIKTNPLYEKGYYRVGCIGCPLATYKQKLKQFSDYPTYKAAYIKAFDNMLSIVKGDARWKTGEDVFNWWIEESKHNVIGQMSLFDDEPQAENGVEDE